MITLAIGLVTLHVVLGRGWRAQLTRACRRAETGIKIKTTTEVVTNKSAPCVRPVEGCNSTRERLRRVRDQPALTL